MRLYGALIACFLAGCATQQAPMNVDARCDKVAWYARSVATLRDIGVPKQDMDEQIALKPQTIFYPQEISDKVYQTKEKTPADIYVVFYAMCINNQFRHPALEVEELKRIPKVYVDSSPTISIPFEQTKVQLPPSEFYTAHQQISRESAPVCYTNVESCK